MEARPHTFTYGQCTDKLMRQFAEPSDTMSTLIASGMTEFEAIRAITATVADGFCDATDPAQATIFFSEWHKSLKAQCSNEFRTLSTAHPELSAETVKKDPGLQRLNGVRRGIRLAMQRQQDAAIVRSKRYRRY